MHVCLSVFTPNCMFVCPSVFPSVCVSVCLSMCLSVYVSVCLCACLSVCLSVCVPVCLCVCLSVCLSVRLSVCLSIRPSVRGNVYKILNSNIYWSGGREIDRSLCLATKQPRLKSSVCQIKQFFTQMFRFFFHIIQDILII
jgi:hypothetical protein